MTLTAGGAESSAPAMALFPLGENAPVLQSDGIKQTMTRLLTAERNRGRPAVAGHILPSVAFSVTQRLRIAAGYFNLSRK